MQKKQYLTLGILTVFFVGVGAILFFGRPVIRMQNQAVFNESAPVVATDTDTNEAQTVADAIEEAVSVPASAKDLPKEDPKVEPTTPIAKAPTPVDPNSYTLADVQAHSSPSSCWAAINGSVFDLTTWIDRHPGGASKIKNLCGSDASSNFDRQHGKNKTAQAALILLKIGTLK